MLITLTEYMALGVIAIQLLLYITLIAFERFTDINKLCRECKEKVYRSNIELKDLYLKRVINDE